MITTVNLTYSVSGQTITPNQASPYLLASNTVKYVKVQFTLSENWASCDSVKAVWSGINSRIVTLLDSDGICYVPHELLAKQQKVYVNLTGSDFEEDTLIDRITTYPLYALNVNATAYTDGSETAPITPSQFEQFVEAVKDEVGKIKDIDSVELNADYTLTISFSDGTETTVGPIRGEQGETGNGIASAVLNDDYTLTLTFTDGTSYTTPSIRGEQGEQGEPGEVTLAQLSAVLPTDTASGAIASFEDGSDLFDYLSCIVDIDPVQAGSGTPSPDNVRPITGWTGCEVDVAGVNLLDIDSVTQVNISESETRWGVLIDKAGTYTVKANASNASPAYIYGKVKSADGTYGSNIYIVTGTSTTVRTITINSGEQLAVFNASGSDTESTSKGLLSAWKIQIETGSTASDYSAYNGTTYPVSWQTEAGTVYGGTVDLVTGVLTVTHGIVDLSSLTWAHPQTNRSRSDELTGIIKQPLTTEIPDAIAEKYKAVAGNGTLTANTFAILELGSVSYLYFYYDGANEPTGNLVYPLATPQTYQLTGQEIACLLGQNNVWANCGDTSVTYKADVQRWVEKMLGQ